MLNSGLLHQSDSGEYSITDTYTTTDSDGAAPSAGGVSTTTTTGEVGEQTVNSHLDSWFSARGYTREDVLVVAAVVQMLAWAALLYLEVSDR